MFLNIAPVLVYSDVMFLNIAPPVLVYSDVMFLNTATAAGSDEGVSGGCWCTSYADGRPGQREIRWVVGVACCHW